MTTDPNPTDTNPFIEWPAEFHRRRGGEQYKFRFANGYGASVIRNDMSYGREQGLWELAVFGQNGHLCYDTPVTDDVLGSLTPDDVRAALRQIALLP